MSDVALQLSAAWPAGATVDQGNLVLGGVPAAELASQYGTPAYIVDEPELRARAREYKAAFSSHPGRLQVMFASKAFPCTAVVRALGEEGLGADVASAGELFIALKAGIDPADILVHGNGKALRDLQAAVASDVAFVVIDNPDEIDRLAGIAIAEGVVQDVLVRVTPDVRGVTHDKISTGQADSKFGFSPEAARRARERIDELSSLAFRGWHAHIGSQLFELEAFDRAIRLLAETGPCEVLDVGGGLGVAYGAGQEPPSLQAYAETVLKAVHETVGPDVHLIVEPGRSVVARSGVTLYTVTSVKTNVSTWVAVDGGMADNLRPMLYQADYEAAIVDRMLPEPGTPLTTSRLAGLHCESGDVLIDAVDLPAPVAGDIVATPTTGAYTFSMANTYNGTPRAPVVFVGDGESRVVVRRETIEELGARDVE
ncbi:MAG: diaminopimelate decarboxylase [Solirubrobacteraceae bacterium]|nr:diaminopimelate decarboxylase [Solirubrobacteraceae bacterium]